MNICKRLCYFSTPNGECKKDDNVPCPLEVPVPVLHGQWLKKPKKGNGNAYDFVCSACGCGDALAEYNYCPNRGAKMGV
jgi:hypothetical protein